MTLLVNSNNTQAKVNLNLFFFLLLAFFLFVLMMDDVEKNSRKSVHIRVNYFHFFVLLLRASYSVENNDNNDGRMPPGRRAPCEIDEEKKYYYEIIKLMMKKRAVLKSDFIGKYLNRVEISIAIVGRFVVPLLLISREKNFFSVAVVD